MEAVFKVEGNVVVPSELAQSPWGPKSIHGGALAALFAWNGEQHPAAKGMHLGRLAIDILRPVPIAPMTLETRSVRNWGRVHLAETTAMVDGEAVARANVTWLRVAEVPLPALDEGVTYLDQVPGPDGGTPFLGQGLGRFTEGMECRFVEGHYLVPGPASAWFRMPVPVVEGYANTPTMTVAAAADFGHGLSALAPVNELLYVNPDLTVTFARQPAGEWVLVRSRTISSPGGHGAAESELYDTGGRVGRSVQSLFFDLPRAVPA